MPDFTSMREILEQWQNPSASVISSHDNSTHTYVCPRCTSWSVQDTLFTAYFDCERCEYATTKVHHVQLSKED